MEIKNKPTPYILKAISFLFLLLTAILLFTFATSQEDTTQSAYPISSQQLDFLERAVSIEEVLTHFKDKTIFVSVKDDAATKLSPTTRAFFADKKGQLLSQLAFREAYVGIIKNGVFIKEKKHGGEAVAVAIDGITIESAGFKAGNFSRLVKGDQVYQDVGRGLNLFIQEGEHILASYTFDYFAEETPLAKGKPIDFYLATIDKIILTIDKKAYQKLENKRTEALATQILLTEDADLVPANITYNQEHYKGEIRLKGDWIDHLEGEQWSFRVKLNGTNTLMGMRKFSLHHPKTRNYAGEWLFHQLLKEAGILHLNYEFLQVELLVQDGTTTQRKNLGIYALEESFDKQLIERNQRREGIILKIDEAPLWQERADFLVNNMDINDLEYVQLSSADNLTILPFSEKRIRRDSQLFKQFLTGQRLLTAYFNGDLVPSEVFDVQLLAKYNAICNLLGANHALVWHNYRFYYNPITSRLEPIGFDANPVLKEYYFQSYRHVEKDLVYQKAYTQALQEVTEEAYVQKVLHWQGLSKQINLLQRVYPAYTWDGDSILHHNKHLLQTKLFPLKSLNVFLEGIDQQYLRLSIENYGKFPVELLGINNETGRQLGKAAAPSIILANEKKLISFKLDANFSKQFITKKLKKTGFDLQSDIYKLKVLYETLGTNKKRQATIIPWNKNTALPTDIFRQAPTVAQFNFLNIDEKQRIIRCKKGLWRLDQPLIIPPNYTFYMGAGTQIEVVTGMAKIISFSPIHFEGTKAQPVKIFSKSGNNRQGLMVFNCQDTSILKHCIFDGLSNPTTKDWVVSGAVNFYKAPVKISNSTFTNNQSEDGLNIINTYFEMEEVIFSNTASDAFDGDFVKGTISNSIFNNLGNDAIDVSGSDIKVQQVIITKAGDKGLSAGESSTIYAQKVLIKESEIGIASKDKSTIQMMDCALQNNNLGFTAFQKKSEFGSASIIADSIKMTNNQLSHLLEKGSIIRLNGEQLTASDKVKERMYGVEFGAKSE